MKYARPSHNRIVPERHAALPLTKVVNKISILEKEII
jgi:hypothetical protein